MGLIYFKVVFIKLFALLMPCCYLCCQNGAEKMEVLIFTPPQMKTTFSILKLVYFLFKKYSKVQIFLRRLGDLETGVGGGLLDMESDSDVR